MLTAKVRVGSRCVVVKTVVNVTNAGQRRNCVNQCSVNRYDIARETGDRVFIALHYYDCAVIIIMIIMMLLLLSLILLQMNKS